MVVVVAFATSFATDGYKRGRSEQLASLAKPDFKACTNNILTTDVQQCDEGHPSCRNCQKSKRECLGYDPIFKPQPGPAPIQPAPGTIAPTSKVSTTSPAASNLYTQAPAGYAPAVGAGFATAQQNGPGFEPSYEYNTAIDPALAVGDPLAMAQVSYTTILQTERRGQSYVVYKCKVISAHHPRDSQTNIH